MTREETAEMLTDVVMNIGKRTDEYIKDVLATLNTYPELQELCGFVVLMGTPNETYARAVIGNVNACRGLLMEGMNDVCTHR